MTLPTFQPLFFADDSAVSDQQADVAANRNATGDQIPAQTLASDQSSAASQQTTSKALNGPWFVASCLLLPVIWGVLVHLVFRRLRRKQSPGKLSEAGWPDYQI